jgi:hypothetical protein
MSVTRLLALGSFAAAGVALVVLEWLGRRPGSRIPPAGAVVGAAVRWRVGRLPLGRILGYALCCWIGWHLFAR